MKAHSPSLPLAAALTLSVLLAAAAARAADETSQTAFEKECQSIAMVLERDINAHDAQFAERHFDLEACLERALAGVNAPARVEEDFRRSAPAGALKTFIAGLVGANSVRFHRIQKTDRSEKEVRVLFRVAPRLGGVDYVDFVIEKSRRGPAKVVDAEIYGQGQMLSQLLRWQFLPLAQDPDRGFLEKLEQEDRELVEHLGHINRMHALNGAARYGESLAIYAKLPAGVQKEKLALMPQLTAASQVDLRGLAATIDLHRATYPDEASLELIIANLHHAKRRYDHAYAALDRFEKALGGDAYLEVVRAQWQKNQGRLPEARTYARKAVARNPKLHEGWELLISLGLATQNYAEVAEALNDWEKASQVDVVRVAESEKLADFARSPEGRKWLAAHDSRRGATAPNGTSASATKVNHRLQGIFYTASNPSAIISGRTVYTGDRLLGGYRVERISPQSVTLQSPEGSSVELALK